MAARLARVNEQVKEVLGDLLGDLKDPRIGFVTITGVDTSPDLSHADVWFTALDDDPDALAATEAGLESAAPMLRRALGDRVRMRRVPGLRFRLDPAPGEGRRIERLLSEATEGLEDQ